MFEIDRLFCIRLVLGDRDGEKCSWRCACGARPRKAHEERGGDVDDDILGNCGLRRESWCRTGSSDHCGVHGQFPEWTRGRVDEELRAGVGYRLQHHAVMRTAPTATSRQTSIHLCAGKQGLQRQQGRQQQQSPCGPTSHCQRIPSRGVY